MSSDRTFEELKLRYEAGVPLDRLSSDRTFEELKLGLVVRYTKSIANMFDRTFEELKQVGDVGQKPALVQVLIVPMRN